MLPGKSKMQAEIGVTGKWGPSILGTPGPHIFFNMGTRVPIFTVDLGTPL